MIPLEPVSKCLRETLMGAKPDKWESRDMLGSAA